MLKEIGIKQVNTHDRFTFNTLTDKRQFADKPTTRPNKTWTEQRKNYLRDKMKILGKEENKSTS